MNILMHSASLYLSSVLIWGTTWFAIKFQLGVVAAEVSLVYRFVSAAIILFVFCVITKRSLRFSPHEHLFMFLQGLCLYCINYLIFYWATGLLTSGVVALLFSTVILMNIVNGAIFMGQRVELRTVIGSLIGIVGIASVFWSEVSVIENDKSSLTGLWYCLAATFSASLGNLLSARNQKNDLPIIQTNAWGMTYGSLIMLAYALIQGSEFNYDPAWSYSVSLAYLSFFGTIIAFGSYLTLVGRIGADKAAYAAVLFPVVALGISTIFENYKWTLVAIAGFVLILVGNYIVLYKPARSD